jgi:hypothetical protein
VLVVEKLGGTLSAHKPRQPGRWPRDHAPDGAIVQTLGEFATDSLYCCLILGARDGIQRFAFRASRQQGGCPHLPAVAANGFVDVCDDAMQGAH